MNRLRFALLLRPFALRLAALGMAGVAVLAWLWLAPGIHRALEDASGDPLWRSAARQAVADERRTVIIELDEASLARVGAWPWPRETMARLVDALQEQGAAVQLLDVVFPEGRAGDDVLAAALARHPVYVGQILALEPDAARVGTLSGALPGLSCAGGVFPVAGGYVANADSVLAAAGARGAGHITPALDPDGSVRRIAPVLCHQQRAYPALALLGIGGLAQAAVELHYDVGRTPFAPHGWLTLAGSGIRLPVDDDGTTRVPYALPSGAFTSVAAADVLDNRVPAGLLNGALALIGATAFGIGDTVPTPLAGNAAGVEIHARFITALLDGALPYTPRAAGMLQLGYALLVAAVLWLLVQRQRTLPSYVLPLAGVGFAALAYAGHGAVLLHAGWWLGWLSPAAFALLAALALSVVEFGLARFERERLYHNLSSYLPEPVAAHIALREPVGTIDAEHREITVLFADLRNFSAWCEARPAEEAAALLHAFFSTAYRVVRDHGGLVEEFVGDAVMAIWNAPQACDNHPRRALDAARALIEAVEQLLPDEAPPGLEPLGIGIGLETGRALVGSFGAAERRTHAALGETVTVAARLQAMSVDLSAPIVVGPGAAACLPDAGLLGVGSFLLEGLQRPRTLHVVPVHTPPATDQAPGRIRLVA